LGILAVASLLVIYSSTASMAYRKAGGDTSHYFTQQILFLLIGFCVLWVTHRINYQFYARIAGVAFGISLLLMCLTFFVGVDINSAQRWLPIPGTGYTFQPSDFVRVTLIMVLARQLARRQTIIAKIPILPKAWPRSRRQNSDIIFRTTIPLLMPVALACGLIFFSNFSTATITFVTCWIVLLIGRVRIMELIKLMVIVLSVAIMAIFLMSALDIGRASVWKNRITTFAGISNKVGRGSDDMQVEQAKIAIASGGIFGKGPGHSTQRANLPHSYSDFAYAFIVEEYGFLGAVFILFLYLWVFFRTIVIFRRCGTAFPSLLVLGLGLLIVLQAFTNMMVSVNLGPVTGQTLPVISLGGSSMLFTSLAFGMILGVSRQTKEQTLDKPKGESLLEKE